METQRRIAYLEGRDTSGSHPILQMKHPFYCLPNSLVILRKYWKQEAYEMSLTAQNQTFQTIG